MNKHTQTQKRNVHHNKQTIQHLDTHLKEGNPGAFLAHDVFIPVRGLSDDTVAATADFLLIFKRVLSTESNTSLEAYRRFLSYIKDGFMGRF